MSILFIFVCVLFVTCVEPDPCMDPEYAEMNLCECSGCCDCNCAEWEALNPCDCSPGTCLCPDYEQDPQNKCECLPDCTCPAYALQNKCECNPDCTCPDYAQDPQNKCQCNPDCSCQAYYDDPQNLCECNPDCTCPAYEAINYCQCNPSDECFTCDNIHSDQANVCGGFGICYADNSCRCPDGFTGDYCDTCSDEIQCNGGGTCSITGTSTYTCTCNDAAITGANCETCTIGTLNGVQKDNVCYYTYKNIRKNWQEARDFCKVNFGAGAADIPIIKDERAQEAVMAAKGMKHAAWILLSDMKTNSVWEWMDFNTAYGGYVNWNPKSPDEGGACAYVHQNGYWLNYHCSVRAVRSVVCALSISEKDSLGSALEWINTGYKRNIYNGRYCNFNVHTCPNELVNCNGDPIASACNGVTQGNCLFDAKLKKGVCVCQSGYDGLNCEIADVQVNGRDCKWINDGAGDVCYSFFNGKKKWEEAGVKIKIEGILKFEQYAFKKGPPSWKERIIFFARPVDEKAKPKDFEDEHSYGAVWISWGDLQKDLKSKKKRLRANEPKKYFPQILKNPNDYVPMKYYEDSTY